MRTLGITAAVFVMLVLSGCGGRTYYHNPQASSGQEQKDYTDCDYEAAKATGNLASNSEREDRVTELRDKCMKARGYSD